MHGNRLGEVFWSPADIEFAPDTILQPDLFVVPEPLAGQVKQWSEIDTLLLVVEVVSPSTAFGDRNRKRPEYQKKGIPEYWIVDLDARIVECWRPDDSRPEILSEQLSWQPIKNLPALTIALPEYFARASASESCRALEFVATNSTVVQPSNDDELRMRGGVRSATTVTME